MASKPTPTPGETQPPPSSSTFGVLRHAHFRNVWLAAFVSSVGGWMEIVGVQWAMARSTLDDSWGGSPAPIMMGYLAAAQLLPQLVFGLVAGMAADKFDRRKLLLLTQVARMAVAVALFVLALRGLVSPWMLIVLGGLDGIAMAFNIPAWQVLTPRLVPRSELVQAITLNGLQFNLARAIGPALAGLMLAQFDIAALFLCNAISYVFVIAAVASTPAAPPPASTAESPLGLIREAFSYTLRQRGPLVLIIGIAVFSMLATPLIRFLPILVQEIYLPGSSKHVQERAYGLLLGCLGVGAVIGALLLRRVPVWYPRHHFVPMAILACSVTLIWHSLMHNIYWAGAAILVCGVFWMWAFNAAFSALQLLVEDRLRGRVLAICNMISFGFMPLGTLVAGTAGQWIIGSTYADARPGEQEGLVSMAGLAVASMLLFVFAAGALAWRTPEIDGLKPGDEGYERKPGLLRGALASAHRRAVRSQ